MHKKRGLTVLFLIISLVAVVFGAQGWLAARGFRGGEVGPVEAYDFRLIDQEGSPYQLSDHQGKIRLLFFGYTSCPDVCPTALINFMKIKEQLAAKANDVQFVFITVDPERDDVAKVKQYMARFDEEFVGLTGDVDTLKDVWQQYGVYAEKAIARRTDDYYFVDHTSLIYLVDRQGDLLLTYSYRDDPGDILHDLSLLL